MDDLMQKMLKRCIRPNGNEDNDKVIVPYSDVIIYAKKGVNQEKSRINGN